MALGDRDLVTRLLKQSILTLCREAVAYKSRLEVDGIICLTADNQDQHVVKIHEFFDRQIESETMCLPAADPLTSEKPYPVYCASSEQVTDSTITRSATNGLAENDTTTQNNVEMEKMAIKTEPSQDAENYSEVKQEGVSVQSDSSQTTTSNIQKCLTSMEYTGLGLNKLTISSAKNILCGKCDTVLENVELFQVHNRTSHNHFTCLVCLATFTSRNNMKRHIRLHTGIKPYSCHKCTESFSRNDDFKRHLLKHTFQKPFRCVVCKTGYSDRSCIKSHMIREHKSKIFYVCPQCGESYTDLIKFQQHKKCHPDLEDYRCSVCSFSGSSALMYNKHMLTHGPLKEYICTHCDLSYSDPFMYTSHLKKHKGDELVQSYTCCFCDMELPSFEQFQRHEHTHVHSKQHVCEVCNKVFRYPSNLREHMLIHLPKSSFQRSKISQGNFDFSDSFQSSTFPASKRDENSSNEDHHMITEEENNNKIDRDIEDVDNEETMTDKDDASGCSDYWCTECSHGFGTESELQKHIIYKHESKNDEMKDGNEEVCQRTNSENITKSIDPYEVSTQMDGHNDNVYQEDTQTLTSKKHALYGETTKNNTLLARENRSLSEHAKGTSSVNAIFRSQIKYKIYEEDAVVDIPDRYTSMLNNNASASLVKHSPVNNTEIELNTVTDAMKQVKNIRSRFGIKSVEFDTLRTVHSKELRKTQAADEVNIERRKSWPHQHGSNTSMSGQTDKQTERPSFVSVSGMKMKIQRGSYVLSDSKDNSGPYSNSKETDSGLSNMINETSGQKVTDTSEKCNSYSKSSVLGMSTEFSATPNKSCTTSLNLKVRNPGFERVVTPEVLFKTKAPFTCEVCEETFESFDDFHDHGVKVHRRFICSYCGKVFTSRPNRERHIRYHTGEKPYKCELCSATFLRGDDLKYHRTTKHADIKPFMCGACQTSFSLPKDLEKHLKMYPDHRL